MSEIYFVTGIDTDAGKSYATAWIARAFAEQGKSVITQKFIQTGNVGRSEDIELHRRLSGTGPLPEDAEGLTAPVIFSYPASAQLAARIDGRSIDLGVIDEATKRLAERYDVVLVEGAGGLMVPIDDDFFTIDYIASRRLPAMLTVNSRLGSINHTILSLEALEARGIELAAVLYNSYFDDADPVIAADSYGFIERYLKRRFPRTRLLRVPVME